MKPRGFTLLELLIVLAIGSGILTGVAYLLNLGIRAHNAGTAEAEARQTLEFALQEIGRAVRETQEVLVPTSAMLNRNNADPTKNPLVVSLSPTLDANNDGHPDADNNRDGVIDQQVRRFASDAALPYPLRAASEMPADATYDSTSGIRGIDDDGDGTVDDAIWSSACGCNTAESNNETDDTFSSSAGNTPDWLDAMVFLVQASSGVNTLVQRQPTPLADNGRTWTSHILVRNVSVFTVNRVTGGTRELIAVKLCLAVDAINQAASRSDVCALRVWRVGGGA